MESSGESLVDVRLGTANGEARSLALEDALVKAGSLGLSSARVTELRRIHGFNEVVAKRKPEWQKLLERFFGLVPLIMLGTALVSVCVKSEAGYRDYLSFGLLLVELLLIVTVDYISDRNAGNAVDAVKKLRPARALALRDGRWEETAVRELLPNDLCQLRMGDVVPADGQVIDLRYVEAGIAGSSADASTEEADYSTEAILVDESSLTGEALPANKRQGDRLLSGGVVVSGEAVLCVTETGEATFFGKTLALLAKSGEADGHLRILLLKVSKAVAALGALVCLCLLFVLVFRDGYRFWDALKFSCALLVAVIPVAMPVVTTTVLSVGAYELSQVNAMVARLSSIEEMAGIRVLCCDKTGTLTKNELTIDVNEVWLPGEGASALPPAPHAAVPPALIPTAHDVMLCAGLASKFQHMEPIDKAIKESLERAGLMEGPTAANYLHEGASYADFKVLNFVPFNPVSKRTEALVADPRTETVRVLSKGAPHVIAELAAGSERRSVDAYITRQASKGLRTLGIAEKVLPGALSRLGDLKQNVEHINEISEWRVIGFISMLDPPREDTAETIRRAQEYGVTVKMITGDQKAVAIETARRLGMGVSICGAEVWDEVKTNSELVEVVKRVDGFSGVFPEHKYRVVECLQQVGELVGMTGDGVNDAPALKKADVGIAVAGATEAAKNAADITLVQPGLSTIVNTLFVSRCIFKRLKNYIIYRLASSTVILGFFALLTLCTDIRMPTWTLVFISIVNDVTILSTSRDNVVPAREPEVWDMGYVLVQSTTIGLCATLHTILFALISHPDVQDDIPFWDAFGVRALTRQETHSALYLTVVLATQLNILVTRTNKSFVHVDDSHPKPAMVVVIPVLVACALCTVLAACWSDGWDARVGEGGLAPLPGAHTGLVWAWAVAAFLFTDLVKVLVSTVCYDTESSLYSIVWGVERTDAVAQLKKQQKLANYDNLNRLGIATTLERQSSVADRLHSRGSFVRQLSHQPTEAHVEKRLRALEQKTQALTADVTALVVWKDSLQTPEIQA